MVVLEVRKNSLFDVLMTSCLFIHSPFLRLAVSVFLLASGLAYHTMGGFPDDG